MKITGKLGRTAIVAGTVTMMLAAGTGTALAATAGPGPGYKGPTTTPTAKPANHAGYTKFTFTKDGRKVTEWVPDSSIGYVTPAYPTDGQACSLDAIAQLIPGVDGDTYVLTKNYWYDAWELVPGSSCIDWLISHHHPKPKVEHTKSPVGD